MDFLEDQREPEQLVFVMPDWMLKHRTLEEIQAQFPNAKVVKREPLPHG